MNIIRITAITGIVAFLFSCGKHENSFNVINSGSFPEKNITLEQSVSQFLLADSVETGSVQDQRYLMLGKLISDTERLRKNHSDSLWNAVSASWYDISKEDSAFLNADSLSNPEATLVTAKWAELNMMLLKLTGEVRFGDVVENLLYKSQAPVLTQNQLKSIIYTHIDDQIFINLIGSSSLTHYHTTGGTVKLTQKTDYPVGNEMTLKCESNDVRFLDVFIRIPSWAVNPTVNHGNVKYVAHPGEYCQISRKWNNGDEFKITLKN